MRTHRGPLLTLIVLLATCGNAPQHVTAPPKSPSTQPSSLAQAGLPDNPEPTVVDQPQTSDRPPPPKLPVSKPPAGTLPPNGPSTQAPRAQPADQTVKAHAFTEMRMFAANEHIGGLRPGLAADNAIALLGPPSEAVEFSDGSASGDEVAHLSWPQLDLELTLVRRQPYNASHPLAGATVRNVMLGPNAALRTTANIGPGSTRADIEAAYGKLVNRQQSNLATVLIGNNMAGMLFELQDDIVFGVAWGILAN